MLRTLKGEKKIETLFEKGFMLKEKSILLKGYDFEYEKDGYLVRKEPVGVVGMITPWNWPMNQMCTKVASGIAAGCTMVLKPSEITPFCGIILAEIIHDDFVFNPHVGGITMGKSDLLGFAGSDGGPRSENDRILFENDSVGVSHSIVHFSNGSASEAVLSFMKFKDGKIVSMETGATPLSDDYKLVGQE